MHDDQSPNVFTKFCLLINTWSSWVFSHTSSRVQKTWLQMKTCQSSLCSLLKCFKYPIMKGTVEKRTIICLPAKGKWWSARLTPQQQQWQLKYLEAVTSHIVSLHKHPPQCKHQSWNELYYWHLFTNCLNRWINDVSESTVNWITKEMTEINKLSNKNVY